MTRKVWELSNVAEIFDKNSFTDFYSASLNLHTSLPKEKFEGFVALAWSMWRTRNLTLFTKEGMDISSTLIKADRVSQAYKDAQETCIKSIGAPLVITEERWFSPDKNWFRLNSDAATNEVDGLAGLGVVVRNSKGEFMDASTSAILEGIKLVEELGLIPLVVESDSLNVIRLMSKRISSNLEIDWVITEVREFIYKNSVFAVKHISRSCNSAAHNVAKIALARSELYMWVQQAASYVAFLL
ncbi:hypothetical protein CUMW_089680 [Citrus unshiu]|nr:hypothetical protein CUMW_089680 [Citrus unshiu]